MIGIFNFYCGEIEKQKKKLVELGDIEPGALQEMS